MTYPVIHEDLLPDVFEMLDWWQQNQRVIERVAGLQSQLYTRQTGTVICRPTANVLPWKDGDFALTEGAWDGFSLPGNIAPEQTVKAINATSQTLWGPNDSQLGCLCVLTYGTGRTAAGVDVLPGGKRIVAASNAATRVYGTFNADGPLTMKGVQGLAGYYPISPATPLAVANVHNWDMTGAVTTTNMKAEWNDVEQRWEAYQMDCLA